jgi:hypothetical protein
LTTLLPLTITIGKLFNLSDDRLPSMFPLLLFAVATLATTHEPGKDTHSTEDSPQTPSPRPRAFALSSKNRPPAFSDKSQTRRVTIDSRTDAYDSLDKRRAPIESKSDNNNYGRDRDDATFHTHSHDWHDDEINDGGKRRPIGAGEETDKSSTDTDSTFAKKKGDRTAIANGRDVRNSQTEEIRRKRNRAGDFEVSLDGVNDRSVKKRKDALKDLNAPQAGRGHSGSTDRETDEADKQKETITLAGEMKRRVNVKSEVDDDTKSVRRKRNDAFKNESGTVKDPSAPLTGREDSGNSDGQTKEASNENEAVTSTSNTKARVYRKSDVEDDAVSIRRNLNNACIIDLGTV